MKIVALSGKIGSGKNYIGSLLKNHLQAKNKKVIDIAFADQLKIICSVKDGIPYEELFKDKTERSRQALQNRGNEERKVDHLIFIKYIDIQLKMLNDKGFDYIIITDLRFKNEMDYLLSLKKDFPVFTIKLLAPQRSMDKLATEFNNDKDKISMIQAHISEVELDSYKNFDIKLYNDYSNTANTHNEINKILNLLGENIESNIETNVEETVEENVQEIVEENVQETVEESVQENVQENDEKKVETNVEETVEESIQDEDDDVLEIEI